MNFEEALEIIQNVIPESRNNFYDGICVKKLAASNTVSSDRQNTHQTHIAITSEQMNIFPVIYSQSYNVTNSDNLKKYFVELLPFYLYKSNIETLTDNLPDVFEKYTSNSKCVRVSSVLSKREGQADQIQLALRTFDDPDFLEFRKLLKENDYLIILKWKEEVKYDCFGLGAENAQSLSVLNGKFFNLSTNTKVNTEEIILQRPSDFFQKPTEQYEQIIYYGVPGSGKSYAIEEKTKDIPQTQKVRVVFHPDYTNADFVGQIVPKMREVFEGESKKSVIEYSFKPGPFTTILRRALRDKGHQYFLIIEEINRGNAAAIFGDLFQLLDRDSDGWSCSPVNNDDINFYVASEYEFWDENYSESHKYEAESVSCPKGAEPFCRNSGLRLPPNLSIYATMNTNDQNVFTPDNAFNRRFKSEYISNKENPKIKKHCEQYNLTIGETGIYWGTFRNLVNEKIIESGFANAEDKQFGLFFVKEESNAERIDTRAFADKVLKYLWHDVFKRDRDIFNNENISKFEDLIDKFNGKDAFENCFANDFTSDLRGKNKPLIFKDAEAQGE